MLVKTGFIGPGNGSPSATSVVLVLVLVLEVVVIRIFNVLRLCRFSTDRYETFHTCQ